MGKKSESVTLSEFIQGVMDEIQSGAGEGRRRRIRGVINFEVFVDKIVREGDKVMIFILTDNGGSSKKETHKIKFSIDDDGPLPVPIYGGRSLAPPRVL